MRKFLLHLLFWVVCCFIWERIMYFYIDNRLNRLYFSLLDMALLSSAFYLLYAWLVPRYISNRRPVQLLVLSVVVLLLLSAAYGGLMEFLLQNNAVRLSFEFSWDYTDLQYNRVFIGLLGILAGIFIKLTMDRMAVKRRLQIVEQEQTVAELNYLKSQLNPHFLFNALNGLHAQIAIAPDAAQSSLIALSDLLRYQLYECNTDFIPLEKEIAHLRNYFELQRIRLETGEAELEISGNFSTQIIAPMLLLPLAENAFKHLQEVNGRRQVKIQVAIQDNTLNFLCENSASSAAAPGEEAQGVGITSQAAGVGLTNVQKRLQLIYPGRHTLTAGMEGKLYTVNLNITL